MSRAPLVIAGDTLLDRDLDGISRRPAADGAAVVVDDPAERVRPGGAGLAALLAARRGQRVTLITALSVDEGGGIVRRLLTGAGVHVIDLVLDGPTPEKTRIRAGGRLLLRVDRASRRPAEVGTVRPSVLRALEGAAAILVSDYGGRLTCSPSLRVALAEAAARVPLVWDPHPRGAAPVAGSLLVTPNLAEAAHLSGSEAIDETAWIVSRARLLARRWGVRAVAVTRGDRGAVLVGERGSVLSVPAMAVSGDCCGAGDSFASAAAIELAAGAAVDVAVTSAVRTASFFVGDGGVARLDLSLAAGTDAGSAAWEGAGRGRARAGVVVATGGCFDVLHAGHLSVLRNARALGDRLIVLLNSDASVRALKGSGRPVVPQEDRAAVLGALACVDQVIIFDEPDPRLVLDRLRPDIWAKGGDHSIGELPEAATVRRWGGDVVILPRVPGRSTTRLLHEVALRPGG